MGLKSETVSGGGASDHVESLEFRGDGNKIIIPCSDIDKEFESAIQKYWGAIEDLSHRILDVAAAALNMPKDYFKKFYNPIQMDLRIANYPCVTDHIDIPEETMGYGAHTDYTGFTVLKADYEVQVRALIHFAIFLLVLLLLYFIPLKA